MSVKGSAKCVVAITPNSTVAKSDLKKTYTPKTFLDKISTQTRGKAKKNLEAQLHEARDTDVDSDREASTRKKSTRRGKPNVKSEERRVIEETESESEEGSQVNLRRHALRNVQSNSSVASTASNSSTKTRNRCTKTTSDMDSSSENHLVHTPPIKGKAFQMAPVDEITVRYSCKIKII